MAITKESIRSIFNASLAGKQGQAAIQEGLNTGVTRFRSMLGLCDPQGRAYRNMQTGDPCLRNVEIPAKMISLRAVSEAIGGLGGRDWEDTLKNPQYRPGGTLYRFVQENIGNTAIQPGAFQNINAWGNAYGGLLEVTLLEAYNAPEYVGDMLFETQQSVQRSEKMPGVSTIGDVAEEMTPGQPHPRTQLTERWVTTPMTKKYGLGIDVTMETVFFDPTGNTILQEAENLGKVIRLRKEKRQLEVFLGLSNSYTYNDTAYNTYLASGNWINLKTGNDLVDWTQINAATNLFSDMVDQETGESIAITGDMQILVMPNRKYTARKIIRDTTVESRTPTTQAVVSSGANPLQGDFSGEPISSPIAYNQLRASGVADADAVKYWYIGQFQRAFKYKQNFPLTVRKISAQSYQMEDNGLVLSIFADEMGAPAIVEPRYVVKCTG